MQTWSADSLGSGKQYYRARYYDPVTGRFASEDPKQFDSGDNFYAYALNNPTNLSDPMGLTPTVAPPPVVSPWTAAEEAAYQAYVRALQGTSRLFSRLGTGALIVTYLFDPSGGNNEQWANSQEAQFERHCKDHQDCSKASAWQMSQAGISDAHQFKEDIIGKGGKKSSYDICACKDGSIVLKAVGQCGKPGPGIDTGYRWK